MTKVSFTTKDGKKVSFSTKSRGSKKSKKRSGTKLKGKALAAARKNIKKARRSLGRSQPSSRSKRSRSSTMVKKSGSRKGTPVKTRLVRFGAGAGIAAVVGIVASTLRRPEVNAVAPILDAAAGIGIEGQIGTAIVRSAQPLIRRALNLNGGGGGNGIALEGA